MLKRHHLSRCDRRHHRALVLHLFVLALASMALTSSSYFCSSKNGLVMLAVEAWHTTPLTCLTRSRRRISSASLVSLFAAEKNSQNSQKQQFQRMTPSEEERPFYPLPRQLDEELLLGFDLTGGRPGAIIETEEQLEVKEQILQEIADKTRQYPDWMDDYGELIEMMEDEDYEGGSDDVDTMSSSSSSSSSTGAGAGDFDAASIGTWTIEDIRSRFEYEWDPNSGQEDPNILELNQAGTRYVEETPKDDDGVEVGYDPIFGPSWPVDKRTILGTKDSLMIDEATRNDDLLAPQFAPGDPELQDNEAFVEFRKSLDLMETYTDDFLPSTLAIPRHVAKWHGYPEQTHFEPQNFTNNRFTAVEHKTDFDKMTPYQARRKAVELARAKNAEWLPNGISQAWHQQQRAPYEQLNADESLVGTLRKGSCDAEIVGLIQPALQVLGSCVELLSIHQNNNKGSSSLVFRFAYHGLMKNKHGMRAWAETLISDCGVDVTGVVLETGFRRRDPAYDGGDAWYGPY